MNHTQPHPTKLLFVCSQNRFRSLTAERIFSGIPGIQVRSAGTQPDARVVITAGHIGWADLIFVMEKSHLNRLRRKFPEALQGKRVLTLHIPDDYEFMQPDLIDELRSKVAGHVALSPLKVGDRVKLTVMPPPVERDQSHFPETHVLFQKAVGRIFRVRDIDVHGHIELWLRDDGSEDENGISHSIWVEPEHLAFVR